MSDPTADERSPFTSVVSRGRIPSLDGLRGVGILLVLLNHACLSSGFPESSLLFWVAYHGAFGVEVFFVISGYLITTLMLREIQRNGRLDIKAFYVRRVLRIIPAYVMYLLVLAALSAAGMLALSRVDWAGALTYTVNFIKRPAWEVGHIWSLSIEEHFYMLWPLVVGTGGIVFGWRGAVVLILGCPLARWMLLIWFPYAPSSVEYWTPLRLDTIAWGCLLAFLTWDAKWRARLDRACSRPPLLFAAATALVASLMLSKISGKYGYGIAYSVNAALVALLMWAVIRSPRSFPGRLLNHWSLSVIGVGSYSLYLWQQLFLGPGRNGLVHRFPQNLLFACAAAAASYLIIERPFLTFKSRLSGHRHRYASSGDGAPTTADDGTVPGAVVSPVQRTPYRR
jgi:peptidoglycan/LPS O-acetylase OafA/YrhL